MHPVIRRFYPTPATGRACAHNDAHGTEHCIFDVMVGLEFVELLYTGE